MPGRGGLVKMRPFVTRLPTRLLTLLVLCAYSATAARAEITAEQVRNAIGDAVVYLQKQQQADGAWGELLPIPGGVTSLVTLSLLTAGVPINDPSLQQALKYLRGVEPKMTYVVALQTMVFCLAEPEKDLLLIKRNVQYL